ARVPRRSWPPSPMPTRTARASPTGPTASTTRPASATRRSPRPSTTASDSCAPPTNRPPCCRCAATWPTSPAGCTTSVAAGPSCTIPTATPPARRPRASCAGPGATAWSTTAPAGGAASASRRSTRTWWRRSSRARTCSTTGTASGSRTSRWWRRPARWTRCRAEPSRPASVAPQQPPGGQSDAADHQGGLRGRAAHVAGHPLDDVDPVRAHQHQPVAQVVLAVTEGGVQDPGRSVPGGRIGPLTASSARMDSTAPPDLLSVVPDGVFGPLASPNRRHYWRLLCRLFGEFFGPDAPLPPSTGLPRREITAALERYLLTDDPWEDAEGESPDTPLPVRVAGIYERLRTAGWLRQERIGAREMVSMTPVVARLLATLVEFSERGPAFLGAKVRSIELQL